MPNTSCQSFTLPNQPSSLSEARRLVDACAQEVGFSEMERAEICLAAHEAVTNAFRYGSPAGSEDFIELHVCTNGESLVVAVQDHGTPVTLPEPTLPDPGAFVGHGRGLYMMCHLMDEVQFDWNGGTVVRMTKQKRPDSREPEPTSR
jgi:anti-sigma regulatory factor (Ser/Thr protein kinase)